MTAMSETVTLMRRPPGDNEIIGLALVIAVVVHIVLITQLSFTGADAAPAEQAPNLDVILVDWASEQPPEQADFLAQANQTGGGDNPELERPSSPPANEPQHAEVEPIAPPVPEPQSVPEPQIQDPLIAAVTDEAALQQPIEPVIEDVPDPLPDAQTLIQQTRNLAQLTADPLAEERVTPKRPRRKFVTANTQEHLYASYMRAWVAKVERVGNMNYPEDARRQNLEGSLVLSVDVMADGSIEHIRLLRSSGFDLLDEAAIRIVRLSAPFSELPPDILAETDILTIIRTWQFSAQSGMN